MHKHIEDIERIVNMLQTDCPAEFGPQKQKIDASQTEMQKKYKVAMAVVL